MGSEPVDPEDPEEVKELGVEAAVLEPDSDDFDDDDEDVDDELVVVCDDSGKTVVIQGWLRRSLRLGLSLGRTLRHLRIMSWHSWVSLVLNRTSALQMASSFS
jgi:hypothetical protein